MAEAKSSDITTHPPRAAITRELVQPPSRVYLELDDQLYIRSRNSLAAVVLRIAGRLLDPRGNIVPFNFEHTPATDRSASLEAFKLAEGFLLSVVVFPSAGAPTRGQTFVEIGMLRGIGAATDIVDVLAKDYVAEAEPLAFPGSPIRSSLEGPGAVRSITGTDPAAGAEVSEAVPTDARWKLRAARAALVTDGTAANRVPHLELSDGTTVFSSSAGHAAHTATLTRTYHFALEGQFDSAAIDGQFHNLLPDVLLGAAFVVATNTTAIEAGDNWGAPQLLVEEWIED